MRVANRDDIFCLVLRVLCPLSGGHSEEVPPVPIPNTVVKLLSVENTWRATARENRTLPEQINGRSEYASSVKHIFKSFAYTNCKYNIPRNDIPR